MLCSFRVENHRSIRDEQELSLLPVYDKTRPVVPVAAVFGANASGKSNLLDALAWMRDAVLNSFASWRPGSGVPRTPFRLDPESAGAPSGYCVEIVVDEVRYLYGFELDDERIREEWLYTYPYNRRRVIFERDETGIRLGSTVADYRARGEQLSRQTRANALFLTVAALNNLVEVHPVYRWFDVSIHSGDADSASHEELTRRLRDDADRASIVSLIRAADLGIRDITVSGSQDLTLTLEAPQEADIEVRATGPQYYHLVAEADASKSGRRDTVATGRSRRKAAAPRAHVSTLAGDAPAGSGHAEMLFHQGPGSSVLGLGDQSAGTRNWIALVAHALAPLDHGGLLVVDEVGASLHPHLTERLINLFRDPETNARGAQLLFTTHDVALLDEDTLSRDEVWFVEKDPAAGTTRLFPLTTFHPRRNENTQGRYLAGSYGAVPVLADLEFREALRRRRDNDEAA